MSDVQVGEKALFGSNNIIDSRKLHYVRDLRFVINDTEKRAIHEMVKEAARFGIPEEEVLHATEIVWRCEARAYLVVKEIPDA